MTDKNMKHTYVLLLSVALFLAVPGCQSGQKEKANSGGLKIVATTTIIGDVVKQIAGDRVQISVLLPPGASPHSFEPTPRDIAGISDADFLFVNGLGLETFLDEMIRHGGKRSRVISVSETIEARRFKEKSNPEDEHAEHAGEGRPDPHVWTDPLNVKAWVDVIEKTLSERDSASTAFYHANAVNYRSKLDALHEWITKVVRKTPEKERNIVTDHLMFGYFCDRYGIRQVGAIIPSFSSMAEPSARELAQLEDVIREYNVKAVFIGKTVNPVLAEQLTKDTGIQLVTIYTGSLGPAHSQAGTYIDYMRYNISRITDAWAQE
jgi:ABC-type Zn uptake system ZnuABC Zn-binding protein ZnuA